jgi:hypothetical protein
VTSGPPRLIQTVGAYSTRITEEWREGFPALRQLFARVQADFVVRRDALAEIRFFNLCIKSVFLISLICNQKYFEDKY